MYAHVEELCMHRQLKSRLNKEAYALSQMFYQKMRKELLLRMVDEMSEATLLDLLEELKNKYDL